MMFTLGGSAIFISFWVPFFYTTSFASIIVGAGPSLFFYMLAITSGDTTFSLTILGYVVDRASPIQKLVASAAASGVLILGWFGVHSVPGLIVWVVLWSFFSGILVSVPAAVVPYLCPSRDVIGTRLGMAWAGAASGILIGNPIASAILPGKLGHFSHAQAFAGAVMLLGAFC